jgi:hypothetical protein
VTFDPLFVIPASGRTDQGFGQYTIEVQNSSGAPLFVRRFDPKYTESSDAGIPPPTFSEYIPIVSPAAAIVVKDPSNLELSRITLSGMTPTVTITSPVAGFVGSGSQTISWTIQDPDSTAFSSAVLYSADNGLTWSSPVFTQDTSVELNFDDFPGSNGQAKVMVLVSDGVNTGSATSLGFTVPKKAPEYVTISSPEPNTIQRASYSVVLEGSAFDPDDGMLTGSALQWSSNLQGPLGQGGRLEVNLIPGFHQITLRATDSDGNSLTAQASITIAGGPPTMTLTVAGVGTGNMQATITASPGANGAGLESVEYSLDNGQNWIDVPLTSLPFQFPVPSGTAYLVAGADDLSGQSALQDAYLVILPETISTPLVPSGPATGVSGGLYMFTGSGATSSLGHTIAWKHRREMLRYLRWARSMASHQGVEPSAKKSYRLGVVSAPDPH